MKVLHINTYDWGGAGKACIRLHNGLMAQGIDSKLLVLQKTNKTLKNAFQFDSSLPSTYDKLKKKSKVVDDFVYDYNLLKERGFEFEGAS